MTAGIPEKSELDSVERIETEIPEAIVRPPEPEERVGFLPIHTNAFDRVFISVVVFIAFHLLWMRFIETALPLWIATILTIGIGVVIVRRG
jgi:predicted small integral membrane protein